MPSNASVRVVLRGGVKAEQALVCEVVLFRPTAYKQHTRAQTHRHIQKRQVTNHAASLGSQQTAFICCCCCCAVFQVATGTSTTTPPAASCVMQSCTRLARAPARFAASSLAAPSTRCTAKRGSDPCCCRRPGARVECRLPSRTPTPRSVQK